MVIATPLPAVPTMAEHGAAYYFILNHVDYQGDDCLRWPFSRDQHGRGNLRANGRGWWAHRLMCTLAHGEPPTPKHTAAHECGKGHEGCVNPRHLRWKTQKENLADCARHGTLARHRYGPGGKLTAAMAQEIRDARGKVTQRRLAAIYGVSEGAINDIWRGRTWTKKPRIPFWTDDEEHRLRVAVAKGMTFRQMTEFVGTKSFSSVMMKTYRLGLTSGQPRS